jgi:hypothetical protein
MRNHNCSSQRGSTHGEPRQHFDHNAGTHPIAYLVENCHSKAESAGEQTSLEASENEKSIFRALETFDIHASQTLLVPLHVGCRA